MIVGLTGRNASGKGTVAEWLKSQGFVYFSLSDSIRHWLAEQGLDARRDHLIWAGRQLREAGGAGVLAERTLPLLPAGQDCLVDSVRNPAEVAVLRRRADFVLVEVLADEALRYERLRSRGRTGDAGTFAEFQRQEAAELTSLDPAAQQLHTTAALADVRVNNDGDLHALHQQLATLMGQWRQRFGPAD